MDPSAEPTWGFEGHDLTTRVARAIYGVSVSKIRDSISQIDLSLPRLELVFDSSISEADRSSSILIFALIEDLMLSTIKQNLRAPLRRVE